MKNVIGLLMIAFWGLAAQFLFPFDAPEQKTKTKGAAEIHEAVLTIDTHVDTPFLLEKPGFNIGESHDVDKDESQVDFPRMKKGGLDAVFFAVFVGQGPLTPQVFKSAHEKSLKYFGLIDEALKTHRELAEAALTPDDAYNIEKKGKRAIYKGVENGYALGHEISNVKKFYELGARYITLCHVSSNDVCDSSTGEPLNNGLSEFGQSVVREMNRLGMMVDVSHISDKSFLDVIRLSSAPVIASHSCCRALASHPRNLPDELLKELAKKGGVIQIAMVSDYVKDAPEQSERRKAFQALRNKYKDHEPQTEEEKEKAHREWMELNRLYPPVYPTVADFVNHIDHVVQLIGVDYVGIGSDYDGGGALADCRDASQMGKITEELVKRGYSEENIRKIWGGNFMRVFREVQKAAVVSASPN